MKKCFYVLMAAIVATAMVACTSDDEGEGGGNNNGGGNSGSVSEDCTIELKIEYEDEIGPDSRIAIGTLEPGEITVDWGDGTVETFMADEPHQQTVDYWTKEYYYAKPEHKYEDGEKNHTIKITGKIFLDLTIGQVVACTEVDVTHCETLEWINMAGTRMRSFDASHNPRLVYLDLGVNNLETLNLGDKPELLSLDCGGAEITTLDLSSCKKLRYLNAHTMKNLTSLDLSNCPEIETVALYYDSKTYNKLSSLKLEGNKKLTRLECYGNRLTSLDVSGCTSLYYLECQENLLTSLNVEGCESLRWLECGFNQFSEDAMTEVYEALPDVGEFGNGQLYFDKYEYGDIAIAHEKGWRIYVDD